MFTKQQIGIGAGLTVAALLAGGCAGEPGGPGAATARDRWADGTRVETRLSGNLDVLEAGTVIATVPADTAFATTVRRGLAVTAGGRLFAVPPAAGPASLHTDVPDSSGVLHGLDIERATPGGPVRRVRATRDGQPFVELTLDWERVDDGWVLRGEDAVVRLGGRELRLRRSARTLAVAATGRVSARTLASALGRALAPAPLQAEEACWRQALDYAAKTAVLALASELVIASPDKITAGLVWMAAWEAWRQSLDAYIDCMNGYYDLP